MKRSNMRPLSLFMTISTVMLSLIGSTHTATDPMRSSGGAPVLKVITRPSLNTYFEGKNGADGLEFLLIQTFAKENHYQLELILADDDDNIFKALDQGIADIALVGEPSDVADNRNYPKSPAYIDITTQLVYKDGAARPDSFDDIKDKKIVASNTEQNHKKFRSLQLYYKDLQWEFSDQSSDTLLSLVNKGMIDYAITDSHSFLLKQSLYTNTRIAFNAHHPDPIHLVYSKHSSPILQNNLNLFIERVKNDGTVAYLFERFYGHTNNIAREESRAFAFLMKNRLPVYQNSIKLVAREFHMDWRLLAAIAYQESNWVPDARSKTGVRGMMMLTNETAQDMGVEDRVNTEQSLRGGAKYFRKIYSELPPTIKEPDRTWFALAAYNVGLGHILDAIEITQFHDGNPNLWVDVKNDLPSLTKKEWRPFIRYGHARGNEPVNYVHNIRHFYDILESHFPLENTRKENSDSRLLVRHLEDINQTRQSPEIVNDDKLRVSGLFF